MSDEPRPYTLVAELTYRCPLRCVLLLEPARAARASGRELDTATWRGCCRGRGAGRVQVNLTGGEPLLRDDLEELVEEARGLELYTNLITSGVPLDPRAAGASCARAAWTPCSSRSRTSIRERAERIAGPRRVRRTSWQVARWVRELGLPLTLNVVLHRDNLERVPEIIALAERLGADGWSWPTPSTSAGRCANRAALLPTRAALERARKRGRAARERLRGTMEVLFVLPDYHARLPARLHGRLGRGATSWSPPTASCCRARPPTPSGRCTSRTCATGRSAEHLARLAGASAPSAARTGCPSPAARCDRRAIDFGGCRCQAFQLTGDAAATDPVRSLSPQAHVDRDRARTTGEPPGELVFSLATSPVAACWLTAELTGSATRRLRKKVSDARLRQPESLAREAGPLDMERARPRRRTKQLGLSAQPARGVSPESGRATTPLMRHCRSSRTISYTASMALAVGAADPDEEVEPAAVGRARCRR